MLRKIVALCLCCVSLYSTEHVYLPTPNLSPEQIIGTNVGIRPFRKQGVRIEAELVDTKLVIHNYGYGGSGLTLAFGGAKEVLSILQAHQHPSKEVAILGAGVVGLATAYDLLQEGYEVHIYSDDWIPNLTSNVAAGIWTPPTMLEGFSEQQKQLQKRMLENSQQRVLQSVGTLPEFAGIRWIDSYRLHDLSTNLDDDAIIHFDNGTVKRARRRFDLGFDGKEFMEDLYRQIKDKGALLEQRHFTNLEDILSLDEPIIINCTSFGSEQLFNDQEFIPIRGQIVYFAPQEGVDYALYHKAPPSDADEALYFVSIYPWKDRLIVNGVFEYNQSEAKIDPNTIEKIIRNAQRCLSEP